MVLLADGEWGIWDIEGPAPGASKGLLGGQGLKGGAMTAFTVSGWIEGASIKSSRVAAPTSRLAPMTPGTRKSAEPGLFNARTAQGSNHGAISVALLPKTSTASIADECVAFWLEDLYAVIPSMRSFWEAQTRKGGAGSLFGGSSGSRVVRVEGVNLRGERCSSIDQCVRHTTSRGGIPTELLIAGEHRFLIVSDDTPEKAHRRNVLASGEKQLAASGNLDVTQIDQVLSKMDSGNSLARRKVGFRA